MQTPLNGFSSYWIWIYITNTCIKLTKFLQTVEGLYVLKGENSSVSMQFNSGWRVFVKKESHLSFTWFDYSPVIHKTNNWQWLHGLKKSKYQQIPWEVTLFVRQLPPLFHIKKISWVIYRHREYRLKMFWWVLNDMFELKDFMYIMIKWFSVLKGCMFFLKNKLFCQSSINWKK